VVQSKDSLYHISTVRFARGKSPEASLQNAQKIQFDVSQNDSNLVLPKGFPISKEDKFRYQGVLVVVQVPIGKQIQLDRSVYDYHWFSVDFNNRRGWNSHWDETWDRTYGWEANVPYVMIQDGLD